MNKTDVYQQADECLIEDMGGEVLLYNPNNATTLHLNGPSMVIWQLCNGENSVQDMIDALQQAYPEQSDQIEADVISALTDLTGQDVLQLVPS